MPDMTEFRRSVEMGEAKGLLTRRIDEHHRHYIFCSYSWARPREDCPTCNGYFRRIHAEAVRQNTAHNRRPNEPDRNTGS